LKINLIYSEICQLHYDNKIYVDIILIIFNFSRLYLLFLILKHLYVKIKWIYEINIICIYYFLLLGQSGLGKSTMVNTLFASHLLDNKATQKASDPIRQTTEINTITHSM